MILRLLRPLENYCHKQTSLLGYVRNGFTFTTPPRTICRLQSTQATTRAYDINTKVPKDVMLFKYENPRFFKVLNIFAVSQFLFWGYLCHFSYTTLKDAPVEESGKEDLPWYKRINLGENKYRNSIAIMCFCIGYGVLFASWMFTLRSVRYLVLRKGGSTVSVVTYAPFGTNRIMDVPLKYVSAQESREAARVTVPIKIKNRALFYVLDMRGEFTNTRLYDYTVGMSRKLKGFAKIPVFRANCLRVRGGKESQAIKSDRVTDRTEGTDRKVDRAGDRAGVEERKRVKLPDGDDDDRPRYSVARMRVKPKQADTIVWPTPQIMAIIGDIWKLDA
uniref:Uncharacterized protein n=1 Tax=Anopheles atroparvus TaxID=41427 RepID=A0A182J6C0_ANOAO